MPELFAHPFARVLACGLLAALAVTPLPVSAQTADRDHTAHHEPQRKDWPGIYNGFLPCADCQGVKTSLALNKSGSYILITQNVGKSPRDFVEKGKFAWTEGSDTIVLTPRNGTASRTFQVGQDTLTELDGKGKALTAQKPHSYVLRRTVVSGEPPEHSGH